MKRKTGTRADPVAEKTCWDTCSSHAAASHMREREKRAREQDHEEIIER